MPRGPRARAPLLLLPLLLLQLLPDAALAGPVRAKSFCSRDPDPTKTGLQWSKGSNWSVKEEVGRFAHLSCCINNASNFNISWYKRDEGVWKELPDSSSSFIYLEDDGQTLLSRDIQKTDGGEYMCVVSSGADFINRTIMFTPIGPKTFIETPIMLNIRKTTYAEVGEKVELECKVAMSTSVSTGGMEVILEWNRELPNGTKIRLPGGDIEYEEAKSIRNHKLVINPMTRDQFGKYFCCTLKGGKCSVNSTWAIEVKEGPDPDMIYHPAYLPALVAALVAVILLIAAGARWHLEIRLFCKDRFGRIEERDDKEYDIFVCYDQADSQFVLETLVHVLENNFGYSCYVWQRDTLGGDWMTEMIVSSVRRSRRFLIVISPALAENPWCNFAICTAIDAMFNLNTRIICVLLKDGNWWSSQLPAASQSLDQVLRTVRKVVWKRVTDKVSSQKHRRFTSNMLLHRHMLRIPKVPEKEPPPSQDLDKGSKRFWRRLRLYLPPRRSLPVHSNPPESPTSIKSLISMHA